MRRLLVLNSPDSGGERIASSFKRQQTGWGGVVVVVGGRGTSAVVSSGSANINTTYLLSGRWGVKEVRLRVLGYTALC